MSKQDKINFFVPFELIKGSEGDVGEMRVKGVCSTVAQDTDGETLLPSGFDFQPLIEKGFLNWNHQSNKNPSAIIGRPTKAEIVENGNAFYIEGVLYKGSQEARSVFQLAQVLENEDPTRRLGFSIEGQALERDPINEKIIRKARITGVAITPCPKNPNTLLSLMKGEYSEPFVETEEDDEDEDKTEKAMSVEGEVGKLAKESVEGTPKDLQRLKKSEIYESIIDGLQTYDEELIKSTYSLIEKFGTEENGDTMIIQDTVQKALNYLQEFQKSEAAAQEVTESLKTPEGEGTTDLKKGEESEVKQAPEAEEAKVEGGEEEDEEDKSDIEKAAQEFIDKGQGGDCVVEELIRKGFSLVESMTTVQKLISDYQGVGNGGQIQQFSGTPLNKSEVQEELAAFDTEGLQTIVKSEVGTILQETNEKFKSFGILLKNQDDENKELKTLVKSLATQNEEILKSNQDLVQAFQMIRGTRTPARSFVTQTQVDKFQKSEEVDMSNAYNLRDSIQKGQLVDVLFGEYANIKQNGGEDKELYNAITNIETTGMASAQDIQRLQRSGIRVY